MKHLKAHQLNNGFDTKTKNRHLAYTPEHERQAKGVRQSAPKEKHEFSEVARENIRKLRKDSFRYRNQQY